MRVFIIMLALSHLYKILSEAGLRIGCIYNYDNYVLLLIFISYYCEIINRLFYKKLFLKCLADACTIIGAGFFVC